MIGNNVAQKCYQRVATTTASPHNNLKEIWFNNNEQKKKNRRPEQLLLYHTEWLWLGDSQSKPNWRLGCSTCNCTTTSNQAFWSKLRYLFGFPLHSLRGAAAARTKEIINKNVYKEKQTVDSLLIGWHNMQPPEILAR